jgi:hypothetical protein
MQPQETGADIAAKLTPEELKGLLGDIAQIAERAYRRGFQHGFRMAQGEPKATADEVVNWRFERPADEQRGIPGYTKATGAPGTTCAGEERDLLDQLAKEVQVESALGSLVAAYKSQAAN